MILPTLAVSCHRILISAGAWSCHRPVAAAAGQRLPELATGGDIELGEDLGQVVLDGARAEEQLGGDLRVRQACPGQPLSRLSSQSAGSGRSGRDGWIRRSPCCGAGEAALAVRRPGPGQAGTWRRRTGLVSHMTATRTLCGTLASVYSTGRASDHHVISRESLRGCAAGCLGLRDRSGECGGDLGVAVAGDGPRRSSGSSNATPKRTAQVNRPGEPRPVRPKDLSSRTPSLRHSFAGSA
jgi:hypothetical protein